MGVQFGMGTWSVKNLQESGCPRNLYNIKKLLYPTESNHGKKQHQNRKSSEQGVSPSVMTRTRIVEYFLQLAIKPKDQEGYKNNSVRRRPPFTNMREVGERT